MTKFPPNEFSKAPTGDIHAPNEVLSAERVEKKTGKDEKEAAFTENTMREHFSGQKKVSVKTKQDEWVQVNGYTFLIKGGEKVEVPEGIAKILEDSDRI